MQYRKNKQINSLHQYDEKKKYVLNVFLYVWCTTVEKLKAYIHTHTHIYSKWQNTLGFDFQRFVHFFNAKHT